LTGRNAKDVSIAEVATEGGRAEPAKTTRGKSSGTSASELGAKGEWRVKGLMELINEMRKTKQGFGPTPEEGGTGGRKEKKRSTYQIYLVSTVERREEIRLYGREDHWVRNAALGYKER